MNAFKQLTDIVLGIQKKSDAEWAEFMEFYRDIVESTPAAVASIFNTMSVDVILNDRDRSKKSYGIQISVSDYLYWKNAYAEGTRFVLPVKKVQDNMLQHLAKAIEKKPGTIEPGERKALLRVLLQETTNERS
jgi:hypothetical protein